jgi:hypothetical protein
VKNLVSECCASVSVDFRTRHGQGLVFRSFLPFFGGFAFRTDRLRHAAQKRRTIYAVFEAKQTPDKTILNISGESPAAK